MSAARRLIAEAEAVGVHPVLRDGSVTIRYQNRPPAGLIERLRALKADIAAELLAEEEATRSRVAAIRIRMAAENESRRNWWQEPIPEWPDRLVITNMVTAETTTIRLQEGRKGQK